MSQLADQETPTPAPAAPSSPAPEAPATPVEGQTPPAAPPAEASPETPAAPAPEAQGQPATPESDAVSYEGITLPEGSPLTPEHLDSLKEYGKQTSMTPEQLQAALVRDHELLEAREAAEVEEWKQMSAGWLAESKADPEVGGDKYDANLSLAKQALNAFWPKEFVEFIQGHAHGDHPGFFKGLVALGSKAFAEPTNLPSGAETASATGPTAESLFKKSGAEMLAESQAGLAPSGNPIAV